MQIQGEILHKLKEEMHNGYKILIIFLDDEALIDMVCNELESRGIEYTKIWQFINPNPPNERVRYVSKREMIEVVNLYSMYDFSDKVSILAETAQYGTLFNYIRTGIITKQEMVNVLLDSL